MSTEAPFDVDARMAELSAAVRELTVAGHRRRAALACVELGQTYENALGNLTAARAWFTRAARLLEQEPPCLEQGWVAVAAMGCDVDDPSALLVAAELALRPRAALRRREPRDEGARRRRTRSRAVRSHPRRHDHARRGHGACLRSCERTNTAAEGYVTLRTEQSRAA